MLEKTFGLLSMLVVLIIFLMLDTGCGPIAASFQNEETGNDDLSQYYSKNGGKPVPIGATIVASEEEFDAVDFDDSTSVIELSEDSITEFRTKKQLSLRLTDRLPYAIYFVIDRSVDEIAYQVNSSPFELFTELQGIHTTLTPPHDESGFWLLAPISESMAEDAFLTLRNHLVGISLLF